MSEIAPDGTHQRHLPGHDGETGRGDQHENKDDPEGLHSSIAGNLVGGLRSGGDGWDGSNRRQRRGRRGGQREHLRGLLQDFLNHDGGLVL